MKRRSVVLLIAVAVLIVAANLVFFVVDETEFAVVTQFGEPIQAVTTPGLQWKWPEPIQGVQFFNNRLLVYNSEKIEFLTSDKKNIVVENYVAWRIADPILFLKSLREQSRAETRLTDVVASELGTPWDGRSCRPWSPRSPAPCACPRSLTRSPAGAMSRPRSTACGSWTSG